MTVIDVQGWSRALDVPVVDIGHALGATWASAEELYHLGRRQQIRLQDCPDAELVAAVRGGVAVGVGVFLDCDAPRSVGWVSLLRFDDEGLHVERPVPNDADVGVMEDGRVGVRVDGQDGAGLLHALDVLDCA